MSFERGRTYDHKYVMSKLGFTSLESFQKWVKTHEIDHFRCNGIWLIDGDVLIDFFRLASKRAGDWKRDRSESRLKLED